MNGIKHERTLALLLALLLLLACSAAFARVEATPAAGAEAERGGTIAYTITAEEDLPAAAVRVALSAGLELDQNSVSAPEGTLYFGSDGLVLMADLLKGDTIAFRAAVLESAEEAVCTVSGSIDETISHALAAPAADEPAEDPAQQAAQAAQPVRAGQDPAGFFALLGAAALAGGAWLLLRRQKAKRAAQSEPEAKPELKTEPKPEPQAGTAGSAESEPRQNQAAAEDAAIEQEDVAQ